MLRDRTQLRSWIQAVVKKENKTPGELSYVFCSDDYLLQMNRDHLQHDYYTDIITFDFSTGNKVSGEMYISIDRVRENAHSLGVSVKDELHRVMIHGVLHLMGYKDKSPKHKKEMVSKEDASLALRKVHWK